MTKRKPTKQAARTKRPASKAPAAPVATATERARRRFDSQRAAMHRINRAASQAGREIGDLPAVVNQARKSECQGSFRRFCEVYFPATFSLEWSPDHLAVIAAIETSVRDGELFAFAMPRGSGKTSLIEVAALWALLYGFRDFVAVIGADEAHAMQMLASIKTECETNDLLLADFPEALYPVVALERIHQRAKGQIHHGQPTFIQWQTKEIQLPTIPGSAASSGIIKVAGITGRIRGMSAKRASDGRKVRPSLVLVDDPQTDDVARSPSQVAAREAVLKGAVLGLAGPEVQIAGLATVTVIAPDDLADRLLDRQRHPAWHGRRMKLVYSWPTNASLWEQYGELRREGQRNGVGVQAANDFYLANREAMDAGAAVAWAARKHVDEISAIQHAWNLRIDRGEHAFAAEFQNDPMVEAKAAEVLTSREIASRAINVPRWIVPRGMDTVTCFVDVQEKALFWAVVAWGHQLRGHLVAYGTYPDQGLEYFTLREAKRTLVDAAGGAALEPAIHAGLEAVARELLDREIERETDDAVLRIAQMFVDANWAQTQGVVRDFARRSQWGPRVLPTHGRFVGASSTNLSDKAPDRGERVGSNWRTSTIQRQRHVLYDTNAWKSFIASRLKLPPADPLAFTLHAGAHDMLAEHLASEQPIRVEARGRVVDEWRLTPGRDNHWLDAVVGSAVAASFMGLSAVGVESRHPAPPRHTITRESIAARREELLRRKESHGW